MSNCWFSKNNNKCYSPNTKYVTKILIKIITQQGLEYVPQ